jgi:hypothetical protein
MVGMYPVRISAGEQAILMQDFSYEILDFYACESSNSGLLGCDTI